MVCCLNPFLAIAHLLIRTPSSSPIPSSTVAVNALQEYQVPKSISTLGANWQNIVLSQAFSITGRETEGLHYYTNVYPTMTISKNVNWTTYRIMLLKNSQDPLAMHFLLAASLIDLATLKNYDAVICRAARSHAEEGMLLLEKALDPSVDSEPILVMTASLFLYRYMTMAKGFDSAHMSGWSRKICNFIEMNQLDDFGHQAEPNAILSCIPQKKTPKNMTRQTQVHLARLILWTFYEDIFAGIGGYGGFLARRLCDNPSRARELYQHSSAELECFWGADYPEQQIIDDIENAPIITFLYEVMALYAEVSKIASSQSRSAEDVAAIESKIEKLEAVSRFREALSLFINETILVFRFALSSHHDYASAAFPRDAQRRLHGPILLRPPNILLPVFLERRSV